MNTTHSRTTLIGAAIGAVIAALLTPALASPATAYAERPILDICTIVGTESHDILHGTDGNDAICGMGG
jgi:hypothetical protein